MQTDYMLDERQIVEVFRMADNETKRRLLRYFELVEICNPVSYTHLMTLDNMGWTGPRYDDYTSVAYWYQTLPSAPLMPLPTDAEMCMR